MTKKHFIKIAKIIKNNKLNDEIITEFCFMFKADNPNFDIEKFKKACK